MSSSTAFDVVVLTFPDARAASVAAQGPLWQDLQRLYPSVTFVATTDPYGCRVGSGGGTLAALAEADEQCQQQKQQQAQHAGASTATGAGSTAGATTTTADLDADTNQTIANHNKVLILHAGGQSSRCPTQMCFGKAWTTFPTKKKGLLTPIHIWLEFMFTQFGGGDDSGGSDLPPGSVAVIAADTMLRIPSRRDVNNIDGNSNNNLIQAFRDDAVVVLTVPAPLETAKNHGVFVLQEEQTVTSDIGRRRAVACRQVLQKPSMDTLRSLSCANDNGSSNQPQTAWIDTGVLLFLPKAANALRRLILEPALQGCTRRGLDTLYNQTQQITVKPTNDSLPAPPPVDVMTTFSPQHAVSIDLYTHILQVLRLSQSNGGVEWESYRLKFPELSHDVARALHGALAPLSMEQVWAEPEGQFLHLGTTRELLDFYTTTLASSSSLAAESTPEQPHDGHDSPSSMRLFAKDIELVSRRQVVISNDSLLVERLPTCSTDAVIYHSVLLTSKSCFVGSRSVVEFCHIECESLRIGDDCWVSGLRCGGGSMSNQGVSLEIPNGMVVQELSLNEKERVYLVLGVNDDVKKATLLYGRQWTDVAARLGWKDADIWDSEDESTHTLWHAKIHPIIQPNEKFRYMELFAWLLHLRHENINDLTLDASAQQWLQQPRLSLADIRQQADASLEFEYRERLSKKEIPTARDRVQTQVRSQFSIPIATAATTTSNEFSIVQRKTFKTMWGNMYPVMNYWINNHMYDVLGTLAMRYATSCETVAPLGEEPREYSAQTMGVIKACLEAVHTLQFENCLNETWPKVLAALDQSLAVSSPEKNFTSDECRALANLFLAISTACTKECVCGNVPFDSAYLKPSPILNEWVISTAPARIDLAGGWSDTPPICYEFGSVVTGMSVVVDGFHPLSSRCRLIAGGTGILLRSEGRSVADGKLISSINTELDTYGDLSGYNEPSSDCALIKCALICLGFASPEHIASQGATGSLLECVQNFFGTKQQVRLEIISTSLLPQGSGMGTSSILAGCILAAISRCRGTPMSTDSIIHMVLELEQLLTTGGGFQDQANGLVGGIKRVTSSIGVMQPVRVKWERITLAPNVEESLNSCLFLVFTGKTRLAKNILKQCLQRWSDRTTEISETLSALVSTANEVAQALKSADLDMLGSLLQDYWNQKKVMAGSNSGVEPPRVAEILEALYAKDMIRGGSLCGAGGGGFLVILSKDGLTEEAMMLQLQQNGVDTSELVWHRARLDHVGLLSRCVGNIDFDIAMMK